MQELRARCAWLDPPCSFLLEDNSSAGAAKCLNWLQWRSPRRHARGSLCRCALDKRDEIVLANALQDEKHCRRFPGVGNEMSAFRLHGIRLAGPQKHLFLVLLQKDTDRSCQDIECVANVAVVVPGHFLRGTDLQFGYAKAWTRGVIGAPLHFVQPARIFYRLRHCFIRSRGSAWKDSMTRPRPAKPASLCRSNTSSFGSGIGACWHAPVNVRRVTLDCHQFGNARGAVRAGRSDWWRPRRRRARRPGSGNH